MITLDGILAAIKLAGAAAPAAKALFDQAVTVFAEDDQEKLKAAYAEAIEASDALHDQVQKLS